MSHLREEDQIKKGPGTLSTQLVDPEEARAQLNNIF